MRVAHINTYPYGGAAAAARRLNSQLRSSGIESTFYWSHSDRAVPADEGIQRLPVLETREWGLAAALRRPAERRRKKAVSALWNAQIAGRDPSAEVFSMAEQYCPILPDWRQINADLIHLHWIAFLADWPSFFAGLPADVPVVWTLHDMHPFSGGCHYDGGCGRFAKGCGHCPQLTAPGADDVSRRSLLVKQQTLRRRRIHVVSPSQWLERLARTSPVWPASATFSTIHNGIPLESFAPQDRGASRARWGIESHSFVAGFGADSLGCHRKGLDLLREALSQCDAGMGDGGVPWTLLLMGADTQRAARLDLPPGFRVVPTGFLHDTAGLASFYSACDVVVVPSREDNQPQVALEAMACGTPVAAFDSGGAGEFVREGVTGRLVAAGDTSALAAALMQLAADPGLRQNLGQRARLLVSREFDLVKQAARYESLYERLLESRAAHRAA